MPKASPPPGMLDLVTAQSVFGRTVLISGPEAVLAERAVDTLRAQAIKQAPDADVVDVEAINLDPGSLTEVTGGSLFASQSVVIVRDLANLPADLFPMMLELAAATPDEIAILLVHGGGMKGKGLLDKLKKLKVQVVNAPAVKAWELPAFVEGEVKRHGGRIDSEAVAGLVDGVGHNLRAVVSAISQLLADSEDLRITERLVLTYFGGRAEVTSFAVADATLGGHTAVAMERLRWALSTGVAPVLVTSAMAAGLRGLGRYVSLRGTGMGESDLAREVGVPPWKLKTIRQQSRGWEQGGLANALQIVATADADVKGAADDADFALERCVLKIAAERQN